jgi:hypothetical protein
MIKPHKHKCLKHPALLLLLLLLAHCDRHTGLIATLAACAPPTTACDHLRVVAITTVFFT